MTTLFIDADACPVTREALAEARRAGGRTRGPAAFEDDDRERFSANLRRLLAEAKRG